ncbi:MAG: nucleoside hydrolase [Acidobacteria bacterium]|nr:nucleoside hydrolase [Acidobacteriota bacterium]
MKPMCACTVLLALLVAAPAGAQQPQKIIFDTDFAYPPQDDAMTLFFALNCPELQIMGITTVAGNKSLNVAVADSLKVLEVTGRTEIPVFRGAASPLMHQGTEWDTKRHGGWYANEPAPAPPGGFAKKKVESLSAVDFIVNTVMQNPGQVTILAIGPLTNIAMAMRMEPGFAAKVKQLVIMGGAIASLPDGGGNHTPNAEFNFYVDPEAAQIVLRSGIPIVLSPLNISRKARFSKEWYDKIVAVDTPATRLIKERMGPGFEKSPERVGLMYDQIAAATLIDPTLMKTVELYVDVDINHAANYGVSVGAPQPWPGGEGARKMMVQTDLDWDRFIRLYVERVTRSSPSAPKR